MSIILNHNQIVRLGKAWVTAMQNEGQYTSIDLSAPITPNVGLGGLRLRDPITAIAFLIDRLPNRYTSSEWCHVVPPWEVRYHLGAIAVAADIRTGLIFKLTAFQDYKGLLLEKIGVGMRVADARRLVPQLHYDERSDLLEIEEVEGVALDVPIEEPELEEVEAMSISAISVYASEISDYR